MKKLHFSFIFLHFAAFWFLSEAGRYFGLLFGGDITMALGRPDWYNYLLNIGSSISPTHLSNFHYATFLASLAFLFGALVVSLILSRRLGCSRANPVLSLVLLLLINYTGLLSWSRSALVFGAIGRTLSGLALAATNCLILLVLGVAAFYFSNRMKVAFGTKMTPQ